MITTLLFAFALGGDAWPGFRGDGSSLAAASLPLRWSPTENIAWRASLPGYGQSSPVVIRGRAYVTAVAGPEKEKLIVAAFDLATGKPAWKRELAASRKGKNNPMMSRAASTPVADADGIVALFESGDVVAFSPEGKDRWRRDLPRDYGEIKHGHGLASSLAQSGGAAFALVDHGPSYLLALDKATGKTLWKADRPAKVSWTSPIMAEGAVVVSGGGSVVAYDAGTGKQLAKFDGLVGNTIPSPVASGDLVVVGAGLERMKPDAGASARSNCCLRLTRKDGKAVFERVWEGEKAVCHHASPVVSGGHAYLVSRAGVLHCVEMSSGKEKYAVRVGACWATPLVADGRLYLLGKDGTTTVVKGGPAFEKLAVNRLWSADDFAARQEKARKEAEAALPKRREGGKGPALPKAEREETRYSAVGDVVYGAAAVDGTLLLRTGTELVCVRLPAAKPSRPLARLFIQDTEAAALRWADARKDSKGVPELGPLAAVAGFPKLDPARQKLVQMKESGGLVCVGVRDDDNGAFGSGWALVRSGVGYIDHGDHGHWTYKAMPSLADSRLDARQGNPAHLYRYGGRFFLANDKLGGYTRLDPREYEEGKKGKPRFLTGGGGHITLAVVEDKAGYSAWIDGGGPNKGRVDVTPVGDGTKGEPAYSFRLPTGGIHGAIANSGKVFFAPADGVCWVEADPALKKKGHEAKVHHVALGEDGGKPRRTGGFASHGRLVLFVTGKGPSSRLVLLDATEAAPKPVVVPLSVEEGTRATTPFVAQTVGGKAYAFVFHDRIEGAEAGDAMEIVELGAMPRSVKKMKVGKSAVRGHAGHHDLAFDSDRQFGYFTNPGDGTVSVLSLDSLEVVATRKVGGKPGAIAVCGGSE